MANATRRYGEAETGYRQALDLQIKGCGPTDPAQKHVAEALAIADKAGSAYLGRIPSLHRAADDPRLVPVSFDRPQRAIEERGGRLNVVAFG